jgi:hypothetical protein
VTEVLALGTVNAPPLPAPDVGVETVTVWPAPTLVTVLPKPSVTLTLAVNVPKFPAAVSVHVNRQGDDKAPALAVTCVHASREAVPAFTVMASDVPASVPSFAVIVRPVSAFTKVTEAVATPFAKLSVPLGSVGLAPLGLLPAVLYHVIVWFPL